MPKFVPGRRVCLDRCPPDPPLEIFLGPMVIVMVIVHAHGQPVLGAKIWKKLVNISYKLRVVLGWAKLEAKIAG